jgi:uncharacterized protein (DUF849 family)
MTARLSMTLEQIAVSAVGAATAGTVCMHLHARDPATGCPTPNIERCPKPARDAFQDEHHKIHHSMYAVTMSLIHSM